MAQLFPIQEDIPNLYDEILYALYTSANKDPLTIDDIYQILKDKSFTESEIRNHVLRLSGVLRIIQDVNGKGYVLIQESLDIIADGGFSGRAKTNKEAFKYNKAIYYMAWVILALTLYMTIVAYLDHNDKPKNQITAPYPTYQLKPTQ